MSKILHFSIFFILWKNKNLTFEEHSVFIFLKILSGSAILGPFVWDRCFQNGHIRRLLYLVYTCTHLLNLPKNLNPYDFGWQQKDGMLLPLNKWNIFPEIMTSKCGCERCQTKMCGCYRRSLRCTSFCKCENSKVCENSVSTNL